MTKGSNSERELVDYFWQHGMATLRAPGSGSIDRPSPDVVALKPPSFSSKLDMVSGATRGNRSNQKTIDAANSITDVAEAIAIELKANPDGVATFDREEIEELEEWSDRCRATAYVGVKPDLRKSEHDGWYFLETSELHTTPSGNYSLRKADHERCLSRSEL